MVNIALIGNNKNVLNKQMGSIIDSYDIKIRFNNFEIRGFEKDVGSDTTYVFCRCTDDVKIRKPTEFSHIYFLQPLCRYTQAMKAVGNNWKAHYEDKCTIVTPFECVKPAIEMGLDSKNFNNKWPSVGILSIFYLLNVLKFPQLTLFGWEKSPPSHYFGRPPLDSGFHDWDKEHEYLKKLEKENKVVFYTT